MQGSGFSGECTLPRTRARVQPTPYLRTLVNLVIYDPGQVSLEHLLLSRVHAPADVMNENLLSHPTLSLSPSLEVIFVVVCGERLSTYFDNRVG